MVKKLSNNLILLADKNGNTVGGVRVNNAAPRVHARSILSDRLALGQHGKQFGGSRDYYEVLGYPRELEIDDYLAKFERDPLGGRIVEFPCEETWRDYPVVKDGSDKEAKDDTEFCLAWSDFAERMRVYHYCQRVDTLAGIGRFGLLLIGVAGSGDLKSEVRNLRSLDQVIYLRPYGEQSVKIAEFETDANNPRFGLPRIYSITTFDPAAGKSTGATKEIEVHWSRCIHVAEGLLENEVYGRPRLQRVYNLLDDILKVVGGSAEATWKLMRKGFVLDIDPEAELSEADRAALQEQFDEYDHGLRRFMTTRGMTASDLGSEVVDPSGIFDAIVTLISAATGIPKRILLGSEQGELASSQDAANWAGRIAARQLNFAEPTILRPLVDRLLKWGALIKPAAGRYTVVWDALFELTDTEKAQNAKTWAEAARLAGAAMGQPVMTPEEYRGEFTPFSEEMEYVPTMPTVPAPGQDVLDQVRDVVANHGYNAAESRAIVTAAARLISREGA